MWHKGLILKILMFIGMTFVGLLNVGCQNNPQPSTNPFLGRTRVPPPGIDSQVIPSSPQQPYYQPSPNGTSDFNNGGNSAPLYNNGTSTTPAPYESLQRSGSRTNSTFNTNRNTTQTTAPQTIDSTQDGWVNRVDNEDGNGNSLAGDFLATKQSSSQLTQTSFTVPASTPQSFSDSSNMIDIGDLPPSNSASTMASTTRANRQSFNDAGYGFDPEYRWLSGRLEYSRFHRQWKLRYIPIDGEMDNYGGSVLLEETDKLSDYHEGDLVRLDGQVIRRRNPVSGFAATYQIDGIQALR